MRSDKEFLEAVSGKYEHACRERQSRRNRRAKILTAVLSAAAVLALIIGIGVWQGVRRQSGPTQPAVALGTEKTSEELSQPAVPIQGSEGPKVIEVPVFRDMMEGITAKNTVQREADEAFRLSQLQFALALARSQAGQKDNMLVSPLSAMTALAMTANGASGDTLAEMERVLGSGMPIARINEYLGTYLRSLPNTPDARFISANSLWLRSDIAPQVVPAFLQTNADYYDADVYAAPFTPETVTQINDWVSEKTEKMIPKLFDDLSSDTVMVLLNALVFDAKWEVPFNPGKGVFRGTKGESNVDFLSGREAFYLETEGAKGFLKLYRGGTYAFAALLPDQGSSPEDLLKRLTPEELSRLLASPLRIEVDVTMPKFSYDWGKTLNQALAEMGMPSAFGSGADFSRMLPGVGISEVRQKTHIEVTESGTRAAAVTGVLISESRPLYSVWLNRPFVYLIIDMENRLPLFIGAVNDLTP